MELLQKGFTLEVPAGAFPLSTDSMVLADFVRLRNRDRVLDLGAGCGTLGLLLCAENQSCQVTGVEIDPLSHEAALRNIAANGLGARMNSICADLRHIPSLFPAGSFSLCVSNPPYFSGGPSGKRPTQRREDLCGISDLFAAAAWALPWGGEFFLVHRPERLAELCAAGERAGLEPKTLCCLRHRPGGPVSLILLRCKKGAKPGLTWQELCLRDSQGNPTADYGRIYHLEA